MELDDLIIPHQILLGRAERADAFGARRAKSAARAGRLANHIEPLQQWLDAYAPPYARVGGQ